MRHALPLLAIATLGLVCALGCNTMPKMNALDSKWLSNKKKDKPVAGKESKVEDVEFGIPESMAVIWSDAIYTIPGKGTMRGFGGRFFFYDETGETISVDGELVVYGFDDSSNLQQRKVADRKFVFRASELQTHASQNDLGVSYSFWVPWDDVSGERMMVSLLPVFKSAEGKLVRGEMSVNVLPGKVPEEEIAAGKTLQVPFIDSGQAGKRQVDFAKQIDRGYTDVDPQEQNRTQMKTTTINVPRGLGEQLQLPQSQVARKPIRMPSPRTEPDTSEAVGQATLNYLKQLQTNSDSGNVQVGVGEAPGFSRRYEERSGPSTGSTLR